MSALLQDAPPSSAALLPSAADSVRTALVGGYLVSLLIMAEVSPQALALTRISGKSGPEWLIILALWTAPLLLLLVGNGVFRALSRPPLRWFSLLSLLGVALAPFSLRLFFSTVIAICYVGVLAGIVFVVNEIGWVRVRRIVMGFGTVFLVAGLVSHYTKYNQTIEGLEGIYDDSRLIGIGYSTNSVAMVAGAVVVIAVTELRSRERARRVPLLASSALIIGAYSTYLTGTRMTLLAVAVALLFGLFRNRKRTLAILAVVTIVGAAVIPTSLVDRGTDTVTRAGSAGVDNGRVEVWQAGIDFANERPLTGWGVATSGRVYDEAFKERDVSWIALGEHNMFLRQYVTTGIGGLLLLGAAVISYGRNARLHRDQWRDALMVFLLFHGITETSTGTLFPTTGTFLFIALLATVSIERFGRVESW